MKLNLRRFLAHVLQLSGLVVGGIGIWTVAAKHSYVSLMSTSTYPTLAYALIVAGVLAVIGSWLGCGGVTSENRCVLLVVSPSRISASLTFKIIPVANISFVETLIDMQGEHRLAYYALLIKLVQLIELIRSVSLFDFTCRID